MSKISKPIETESGLVVPRAGRGDGKKWGMAANGTGFLSGVVKMF